MTDHLTIEALETRLQDDYEVPIEYIISVLDFIFANDRFIQSMEVYELGADQSLTLRVDLSILGLEHGYDDRAPNDRTYARLIVDQKLSAIANEPATFVCQAWLNSKKICS